MNMVQATTHAIYRLARTPGMLLPLILGIILIVFGLILVLEMALL
jgi:hypothetical protein